jgi:hypothetical protein
MACLFYYNGYYIFMALVGAYDVFFRYLSALMM